MYCRNCGKEISEETRFCPACGSKQFEDSNRSHETYDDPFTTSSEAIEVEDKPAKCWSVFALIGKILGIVSLCLCWIPYPLAMALGIPGIVMSCLGRKAIDEDSIRNRTIGLKLSIAGTVVSFVVFIVVYAIILSGATGALWELFRSMY